MYYQFLWGIPCFQKIFPFRMYSCIIWALQFLLSIYYSAITFSLKCITSVQILLSNDFLGMKYIYLKICSLPFDNQLIRFYFLCKGAANYIIPIVKFKMECLFHKL